MKTFLKITGAVALTGVIALAAASPSEARSGRNAAAAVGFGAGALVGAAAASSYNNDYYYGEGYAYEPAAVYGGRGPAYYYGGRPYGLNSIRNCTSSPSSQNFGSNC
jgi:hypothetical protein